MGLDIGEKRIGIALSDPMGWTAQGHSVLKRQEISLDLQKIKQICLEYDVEKIVIGFPRNMDGTIGSKALEVQDLGQTIATELNLPVEYWDERLSTKSAERILIAADMSRRRRKQVIDKMAAVGILQAYLDHLDSTSRNI